MTLSQTTARNNPTVIPFTHAPAIARRVRSLMMSYTGGKISRAARNEYLGDILPLHGWVDVGTYRVKFDGYTRDFPAITFEGEYSASGTCPVCLCDRQGSYLAGEGLSVQLWCHSCGAIYESPEEVLR